MCILDKKTRLYGEIYFPIENKESYKEFRSSDVASDWGTELYGDWGKRYKSIFISSNSNGMLQSPIECYAGFSYTSINEILREQEVEKNSNYYLYKEMGDLINLAIYSAPRIPFNVIVYRMVGKKTADEIINQNRRPDPHPYHEKGFLSTSLLNSIANDSDYADKEYMLKIYIRKGSAGIYVNALAKRSEEEILFPRGSSLGMASYPYRDDQLNTTIIECNATIIN